MTVQAQNALLKTLEEMPSYGIVILIAANTGKILPTILSRSFRITITAEGFNRQLTEQEEVFLSLLRAADRVGPAEILCLLWGIRSLLKWRFRKSDTLSFFAVFLIALAVFLLLDIRHAPSQNDKMMYDWIVDNGYQPIIIATKLDKIKRSQVQKQVKILRDTLSMPKEPKIIPFSSQTKQGKEEIHAAIADAVRSIDENEAVSTSTGSH